MEGGEADKEDQEGLRPGEEVSVEPVCNRRPKLRYHYMSPKGNQRQPCQMAVSVATWLRTHVPNKHSPPMLPCQRVAGA